VCQLSRRYYFGTSVQDGNTSRGDIVQAEWAPSVSRCLVSVFDTSSEPEPVNRRVRNDKSNCEIGDSLIFWHQSPTNAKDLKSSLKPLAEAFRCQRYCRFS